MQPNRAHEQVVVERFGAEDFRQTSQGPPPQIVHLEQPVPAPWSSRSPRTGRFRSRRRRAPGRRRRAGSRPPRRRDPTAAHRLTPAGPRAPGSTRPRTRRRSARRRRGRRQAARRGPTGAGSGASRWPWFYSQAYPYRRDRSKWKRTAHSSSGHTSPPVQRAGAAVESPRHGDEVVPCRSPRRRCRPGPAAPRAVHPRSRSTWRH